MSAPAPSRRSAALALEQLTAEIRSELYLLLDDVGGQICLVLDRGIGGQLDHVVPGGAEALRSHGVRFVRSLRPELDAVREHQVSTLRSAHRARSDRGMDTVRTNPSPLGLVASSPLSRAWPQAASTLQPSTQHSPHAILAAMAS